MSETAVINAQSYTVEYSYDAASKMVSVVYPDMNSVTYEYDAMNRVVAIPTSRLLFMATASPRRKDFDSLQKKVMQIYQQSTRIL